MLDYGTTFLTDKKVWLRLFRVVPLTIEQLRLVFLEVGIDDFKSNTPVGTVVVFVGR